MLPLLSALVAGCVHALEADHMAAVTTFVSRRPHPLKALGFGVRWGLGHSAMLLLAGGTLILLDLRPPPGAVRLFEAGVGAMLLGLGVWVLVEVVHGRALRGDHELALARGHRHGHLPGATWVGAAHGLAGTTGFLALLPAAMLASPWLASSYLALFGAGTMASMGAYALGAGLLFRRAGAGAPVLARIMRVAAGATSGAVGCLWIARALS
ncbi:MAG TPA: hypothetical protein VFZ18_02115 [Longimicrobiaceae bacterium]